MVLTVDTGVLHWPAATEMEKAPSTLLPPHIFPWLLHPPFLHLSRLSRHQGTVEQLVTLQQLQQQEKPPLSICGGSATIHVHVYILVVATL